MDINKHYKHYLESGVWKCKHSPTGAHHWIADGGSSIFICKHCGRCGSFATVYEPPAWVPIETAVTPYGRGRSVTGSKISDGLKIREWT